MSDISANNKRIAKNTVNNSMMGSCDGREKPLADFSVVPRKAFAL